MRASTSDCFELLQLLGTSTLLFIASVGEKPGFEMLFVL